MHTDVDISQYRTTLSTANELVYERKFDVALRDSHAPYVLNKLNDPNINTYEYQILREHLNLINVTPDELLHTTNIYPIILNNVFNIIPNETKLGLEKLLDIVSTSLIIQFNTQYHHVSRSIVPDYQSYIGETLTHIRRSKFIPRLMIAYYALTNLVDQLPKPDGIRIRKSKVDMDIKNILRISVRSIEPLSIQIRWSRQSALILVNEKWYIVPRSYVLLIHNKIADLLSVMLLASSYPDTIYDTNCLNATENFIKTYCNLAIKYDQTFFKISKVLESLIIGETLLKTEGTGNSQFIKSIADSLEESTGFSYLDSRLRDCIITCEIPLMHEFGCLSKLMGHPFCRMEDTAVDMYNKTHEVRAINVEAVNNAARHSKKEFVEKYLERNSQWPPCHLHNPSNSILKARESNINPARISHINKYGPVPLEDWDAVVLEKCENFDRLENFIPFVKDRTISLLKSEVVRKYINEDKDYKVDWKKTRALLAYLFLPYEDTEHLSYLELYAHEDWEQMLNMLIVRLVPKEKEHKDSARCFGCKPAKERARTTTLGENAARYLSRYGDSDAMTLSEISLSKKLFAFRNMSRAYEKFSQIIICIDASGWNSRLRNAAIGPISAASLDAVFGEHLFTQAHEAYHNTYFYLPDVDRVYTWPGQEGGVEGQDTYIWVHAYIQHLKIVMTHFGYPYRLLVKGDDARLVILVPPQYLDVESIDQIRTRLVTRITQLSAEFGYQMKPEDSYGSVNYCSFSKNAFLGNVEMPQSFRKIQKAYGANNAFMNTIDDYAASSFSNCHSASKTSPSPISCYIVALIWFYMYLIKDKMYRVLSDSELVALSLIPNMMGGFPIIYLHNFYQRAESDLLTSYINIVITTRGINEQVWTVLSNTFHQILVDPYDNVEMLCIDPYSLPFKKPSGSQGVLRNALSKTLKSLTRNEQIKQLFEARLSGFQEALLMCLSNQNIYSPKIMNQIHSASPEGLISELITKFESGKSMLDAVLLKQRSREGFRILRQAIRADISLHKYRISILKCRLKGSEQIFIPNTPCPSEASQIIRDTLWKKRVEGVTQSPVSHMVHILTLSEALNVPNSDFCHFKIVFSPPKGRNPLFEIGPNDAFLGDSTSKGLVSPEAKLTGHNIYAMKIANLLETYRWTTITTPIPEDHVALSHLVGEMINRYTKRNVTDFIPFSSARPLGKTIQHHVRANQYKPSIVPNTLQNIYTWCKFDMLSHKHLTTVHGHSKFNFHEIKCWGASMMASRAWMGELSPKESTYWMVTTNCAHCNQLIQEHTITYTGPRLPNIELIDDFQTAKHALQEILTEVDEFNPELYHLHQFEPGNDNIEDSIRAVCQALMDSEWSRLLTIQELEANHLLTSEGNEVLKLWNTGSKKHSILDFNDLLGVEIDIIIEALVPLVISNIYQRFDFSASMALGTILTLTPSNILPWTSILIKLANVNKFRPLQERMSRLLGKTPNILDNPATYSARFGDECMQLWHRGMVPIFNITLCSAKADTEVANAVKNRITALRLLLAEQDVRAYRKIRKGTQEEVEAVLTTFCYMVRLEYAALRLEFEVDERGNVIDNQFHTVYMGVLDMDDEFLPMLETLRGQKYSYLLQHIKHLDYPPWLVLLLEEYDVTSIEALETQDERLLAQLAHPQINVSRVDLLTCKNIMQNLREELPNRTRDWANSIFEMRPLPNRINNHFVRIAHFDERASLNKIPDLIETNMNNHLDIEVSHRIVLDRSWTITPLGLYNISMSRVAWLLQDIELINLGYSRIIAAFGDGYGGYTQVINQIAHDSKITFMTSPTSLGESPIPSMYTNNEAPNEIDTYMIEIDRWDLIEWSNFIKLEEHRNNLVDVVYCDAELPNTPQSADSYLKMWHNISTYSIRNCRTNCIMFIKVYLEFWREILVCLNLIRPYTSYCAVMHASGSPFSMELYIVAQFQRSHPINYQPSPPRLYPPEIVMLSFSRFSEIYTNRFRIDMEGLMQLPILNIYPDFIANLCRTLPSYGWHQLESVIRTSFDYNTLRRRNEEDMEDYCNRIISLLNTWLKPCEEQLLHGVRFDRAPQSSLYMETKVHTAITIYKMCVMMGFRSSYINLLNGINYHTMEYMHHTYVLQTNPYHACLNDWDRSLDYSISRSNVICDHYNMFAGWTSGAKWGSLSISWGCA